MAKTVGNRLKAPSGEELIGTFNNESRDDVALIKQRTAELVDMVNVYGQDRRRNAIACTHLEEAAIMAVKSIFS